ncbi:MAG: hypothetical protein ABF529_04875, partial [Bifidobacterium sp.]
ERVTSNLKVVGSNPTGVTILSASMIARQGIRLDGAWDLGVAWGFVPDARCIRTLATSLQGRHFL